MEALAELIPLLLVAGYYILAARRRAAKRRAAQQQVQNVPEVTAESRGPTPFQQFMEQLEEAMAEAAGEPEPDEPAPIPKPVVTQPGPVISPPPSVRPTEFQAVSGSFDATRPVDHEAHGFGPENPLSEESFERRPTFAPRPAGPTPIYDPHGLKKPRAPQPQSRRLGDLRQRLRTSEAAREAFVLQTIFGPRGGRRGENR